MTTGSDNQIEARTTLSRQKVIMAAVARTVFRVRSGFVAALQCDKTARTRTNNILAARSATITAPLPSRQATEFVRSTKSTVRARAIEHVPTVMPTYKAMAPIGVDWIPYAGASGGFAVKLLAFNMVH